MSFLLLALDSQVHGAAFFPLLSALACLFPAKACHESIRAEGCHSKRTVAYSQNSAAWEIGREDREPPRDRGVLTGGSGWTLAVLSEPELANKLSSQFCPPLYTVFSC